MVSTQLQGILKEFEAFFNCPLVTDENESCQIEMGIGINIQLELNRYGSLLVGCRLGSMVGRYRDQIFKEAMKANYLHAPSSGVFGYSQKSKNLILFMLIDPKTLKPDTINRLMVPFINKAKTWVEAIKAGTIPAIQEGKPPPASDNPFGLQR